MSAISPCLEVTDAILDVGGETLNICMQCGTCSGVCPWNLVKSFSPRNLIKFVSLGIEGIEGDALWNCVTCNTCVQRCPRGIDIVDVIRATRSVMVEMGSLPPALSGPLGCLRSDGNPWMGHRKERAQWQEGLDIPVFSKEDGIEWLYFTCCTQAYDPRNTRVAKALVSLLKTAKVSFGSLGEKESCCGDMGSKAGGHEVFGLLKKANSALFEQQEVDRMIVPSPHCLNAFTKDYDDLGEKTEILHHTVLFSKLIREKKIQPTREIKRRVTYHDPCYLGRHNGIYDEPREVLNAIPGLELVEMPRNREHALCCGGGGGGMWAEVPIAERFAVLRLNEAKEVGADVIATACPICTAMFEDAIKVMNLEGKIAVKDIAELLHESVEEER